MSGPDSWSLIGLLLAFWALLNLWLALIVHMAFKEADRIIAKRNT